MPRTASLALISFLIATSSTGWAPARGRPGATDAISPPAPIAAPDGEIVVIEVDCDAARRIADALAKPARDLVIKIRGICEENHEILQDNVMLIGTDRTLDGIPEAREAPVVSVRRARAGIGVRLPRASQDARAFCDHFVRIARTRASRRSAPASSPALRNSAAHCVRFSAT